MLKAHHDPEFEGASRKLAFIEQSVEWIKNLVPPAEYPLLFDLGCGPGIYAEGFSKAGYQVTGIDYSKRSIAYARGAAQAKGLAISYYNQDYLNMDLKGTYDFATMIYCDYGALSTMDRKIIMEHVYHRLRKGGKFLLDVFSMEQYREFQERQTWERCPKGGFWREEEYFALTGCYRYTDNVTLEQIAIFSKEEPTTYYLWHTYFTREMLIEEAKAAGFRVEALFGDVAGHLTIKRILPLQFF